MAKAVMDSRMLDLPLSEPFYRWLLAQEGSLTLHDLNCVNPDVARTLQQLQAVVRTKEALESSADMTAQQVAEAIDRLELDGCPIADLGLDFTLPGHPTIELRRGGRDIPVTAHNLDQYCKVRSSKSLHRRASEVFEVFHFLPSGFHPSTSFMVPYYRVRWVNQH